jgi:Holliday junction DNA helicase RuvA
MYEYLKGTIANKATGYVVLDVGGVGYRLVCDSYTANALNTGETAKVYTYMKAGDDGVSLFGFHRQEQKEMFEKLISISGVGPKAAVAVLSALKVNDIAAAVITNDEKAFLVASGIGKKIAQRICMELKEKIDMADAVGAEFDAGGELTMDAAADACAALVGLGYNRQEAVAAVSAVKNLGDTAEELVALALKRIGG